ncbi:MAG: hypothetical protein NVV60_14255 [Luteimonas sp.]|nr:hypothetical protein [Luteimonas sp.]
MFSAKRFSRLVAAHWIERWRGYVWLLGGVGVVHLLAILMATSAGRSPEAYSLETQHVMFGFGYALSSVWLASSLFAGLSRESFAITLLMRPASMFEKWLLVLLVVCIVHPLAYTLVFQVCGYPAALLAEQASIAWMERQQQLMGFGPHWPQWGHYVPFAGRDDASGVPLFELYLWSAVSSISGLVVAGVLYFRRRVVLKSVAGTVAIVVICLPLLVVAVGAHPNRLFLTDFDWITSMPLGWIIVFWAGVPALVWLGNLGLLRSREVA